MSTADTRSIEWQQKQKWEQATERTERLRVPGGWIYRTEADEGLVFVPDPQV